jgi:predicted NAD-dependent protein-ADP-ribosyltransferase YbiA (DUF1768 family)
MVLSRIDNSIHYKENREIEESDKSYVATVYQYDILGNDTLYTISLGQEDTQYSSKNVYFFRVYLVAKDEKKGDRVKSQIGVVEYKSSIQNSKPRLKTVVDADGDVDIYENEQTNRPLFYSFVTNQFLQSAEGAEVIAVEEDEDDEVKEEKEKVEKDDEVKEEKVKEDDEVFDIISNDKDTTKPDPSASASDVFVTETQFRPPELLKQETAEMAKQLNDEFRDSSATTWIEKFMKNNEYAIVETISNGDCFFDTIVKAYQQIGKTTTIAKLRAILAEETTQTLYEMNRAIYLDTLAENTNIKKQKSDLKGKFKVCKIRAANPETPKSEVKKIINEDCPVLKEKYTHLKQSEIVNNELLAEFKFMEHVDTMDKLKEVIQTTQYWANTWAISTLERRLNVKIIVMSKEAFDANDLHNVLLCGQLNDTILERQGFFRPDHYILTEYSGNHYQLISYKQKRIFEFPEIPFNIKTLIFNKCLERNAGPYYLIDDIRNFNSRMGNDMNDIDNDNDEINKHLYDNTATFAYYAKSSNPKPGKWNGESMKENKMADFAELNQTKDWRRMLDDQWIAPYQLDDHTWETVEHYYQASKFKQKNRDFYLQFTSNSESPFAKDPELAHAAGSIQGAYKDKAAKEKIIFRDKNKIKVDPDFYVTRHLEERRKALYAKFSQNEDLKKVLLATKKAKLMMFVPRNPAVMDTELMIVRNDLATGRMEV